MGDILPEPDSEVSRSAMHILPEHIYGEDSGDENLSSPSDGPAASPASVAGDHPDTSMEAQPESPSADFDSTLGSVHVFRGGQSPESAWQPVAQPVDRNSRGFKLAELREMGFSIESASEALAAEDDDLERAIGRLLSSTGGGDSNAAPSRQCIICMDEPRGAVCLHPCRHSVTCEGCADELINRSRNCPLCRAPVERLVRGSFMQTFNQRDFAEAAQDQGNRRRNRAASTDAFNGRTTQNIGRPSSSRPSSARPPPFDPITDFLIRTTGTGPNLQMHTDVMTSSVPTRLS